MKNLKRWKAVAGLASLLVLLAVIPAEPQSAPDRSALEQMADRAVEAANAGKFTEALRLYRQLERSSDRSFAWEGISGQVIVHRIAGDGDSARAVTERIAAEKPELAGLMDIWDGDTAMLEKDVAGAVGAYRRAADIHGRQLVDGRPIGATALRQLTRAHLERKDPLASAETERELLRRFPGFVDRDQAMEKILAFEAMASGELPVKPIERLLEDGDCSPKHPCVLGRGGRVRRGVPADARPLAGQKSLYVSEADTAEFLQSAADAPVETFAPTSTADACVVETAYSGFLKPMLTDTTAGYKFMETPDCCGGWHPGIDLNRGGYQADCNDPFYSTAEGCVMDVMASTTDWGSAAIEHYYPPSYWTSQYGHAYQVYVSVGQWVRRGKLIGRVGGTADGGADSFACHLHFEIREPDHTDRNNASAYHNTPKSKVGDEYQDPLPFINAHKRFTKAIRRDENSFTFTPDTAWTLVSGIGDDDDMRWALTTPTSPKTTYARHTFTATATGTWELWAFIPYTNRSSTAVPYRLTKVSDGTLLFSMTLNQAGKNDAWLYVGSATLTKDIQYRIEVATNTGETDLKVAVDDFLLIKPNNAARANLNVSGITFTSPPAKGVLTTAVATLSNIGTVASGTFNVKWFVDNVQVGYGGHESLGPGQVSNGNIRFDWTPATGGVHTIEFIADVDGHVIEGNEFNNNFKLKLTIQNPADLKVSGISFTSTPKFGVQTTAKAALSNVGQTASGEFNVKWFVDGVQKAYGGHKSLAPGEVSNDNVYFNWTPTAGEHTLQFVADVDAEVSETNESNNSYSVPVTIPEPPDLEVRDITLFPSPPVAGMDTIATAYLINEGGTASGEFNVKWFLDGVQMGYGGHISLAPGQVSADNVHFYWTPAAGTHTLTFVADVDGEVLESDEDNNSKTITFTVSSNADLVVSNITFSDSTPNVYQLIVVTATLSNTGSADSGVFNCKWFLDGFEKAYFSQTVPAGATVYPWMSWDVPAIGTYSWKFVADVDGHVVETNEGNNSYTKNVTATCAPGDICPTSVIVSQPGSLK